MFKYANLKTIDLKSFPDPSSKCENCNATSLNYIVRQSYYHLLWIPVFPLHKFVGTHCKNCGATRTQVYSQNTTLYEKKTTTPIYLYALPILFTILATIGFTDSILQHYLEKDYVNNPKVGDVYCYKFKDIKNRNTYTFFKITSITKDAVNGYQCNTCYDIAKYQMPSSGYFVNRIITKSKNELINMYNNDNVVRIFRDYDISSGFNDVR